MYLNTRIFPTSGYARVLLFMFIRRGLGGTGTGCLFQFAYCETTSHAVNQTCYSWMTFVHFVQWLIQRWVTPSQLPVFKYPMNMK